MALLIGTDAGESWTRVDEGDDRSYVREILVHEGTLLVCGATGPPPEWGSPDADPAIFESSIEDGTPTRRSFPGAPNDVVDAWTTLDDRVIAGAGAYRTGDSTGLRGRILRRDDGDYHTAGRVPGNVTSLASL